ncbi:MAG: ABC transporter permease [Candidatus Thiodiazotropha sp. (ex Lucina aurantia)]|uniref:Bicarbonate transport system permease protein CmpB n=1 Tax=Candidatus Thiodiazotropha endolucinida TaxID=1655433 RepID=A0A7Z0VLU6_9GAMM|nr:ABC transporter permease [Candidatus Thiodiazotropha sp. (ex Lucina pensylvanica)]MBT3016346.1 ABC transporter permease [Candidatus Thiodiazotropha taylori]MBT3039835.1 ABC transporter permease [Candidatus Thiodiazotropha sp. (ex Codakia orbicularis)]MBV2103962.1 ABC transporter permease [Candidatus Thiodiazotropha sp. (ex Lucina aurantia)]MCU7941801.1 ABC transporter permease [Candidatus Thiodiazotropha sp. (ex Cardiolucina cf. quadrata)]ODJ88038.1 bicarbonate transport system permease pro
MSEDAASFKVGESKPYRVLKSSGRGLYNFFGGLAILFVFWWIGGYFISINPSTEHFAAFGPIPTFKAFPELWSSGTIQSAIAASGYRLGLGLLIAIVIGVPIGILMGRSKRFREISNSPFQLLRMISPLAWMPLAVIVFATWNQSIIFLIAIASVWPVAFATAAGLAKIDPAWFKVARNLGAKPIHMMTKIILPAISFDVFTGIRLALGVAWIVLVPAEYLGVTSGLGYSIEDARETLSYHHLTAIVLVIGALGYILDSTCVLLIKHFSWHRGDES